MSGDGVRVDPEDLKAAAEGINTVVGELNSLAHDKVSGDLGRGFGEMKMPGLQAGTAECKSAFDRFCDRWEWGVRSLIRDANKIAFMLGLDAGLYHDVEQLSANSLKELTVDAMSAVSNPHVTDEQADRTGWSEILSAPRHDFDHALDPAELTQLQQDARADWSRAWDDSMVGRAQHHDFDPFDHGQGYKHG